MRILGKIIVPKQTVADNGHIEIIKIPVQLSRQAENDISTQRRPIREQGMQSFFSYRFIFHYD